LTVTKGGVIVQRDQFTTMAHYGGNYRLTVPIVTTQACKAKFYWDGPNSDIHQIRVYYGTKFNFYDNVNFPYRYTYDPSATTSFPIDLNIPGTWWVYIWLDDDNFPFISFKNITLRITT
jgi:hypothetical protein